MKVICLLDVEEVRLAASGLGHQILVWNEAHLLRVAHWLHLHGHHHRVLGRPGAKVACTLLFHQVDSAKSETSLARYHVLAILLLDLLLHLFEVDEFANLVLGVIGQRSPSVLERLLDVRLPRLRALATQILASRAILRRIGALMVDATSRWWEVFEALRQILLGHFQLISLEVLHVVSQVVKNLRGVIRVKNILTLHFRTIVKSKDLLLSGGRLLLFSSAGAGTENGLVHVIAEILGVHGALHVVLAGCKVLVVDIANMTDRVVMVVMIILRNDVRVPFRHLCRFLSIL